MVPKAEKKEGCNGVLKICDVNAEPFRVILDWIYTSEVKEGAGRVMGEVVEAAVKYQLGDLLIILDKKLIEMCNVENMFQFFKIAKEIPLPTAIEDISLFIKGNL